MPRTFKGQARSGGRWIGRTVRVEEGDGEVIVTSRDDGSGRDLVDRRPSRDPRRDAEEAVRSLRRSSYREV